MKMRRNPVGVGIFLIALVFASAQPAPGQEASGEVVGDLHARGFAVLKLTFPSRGDVLDVSLELSADGETYAGGLRWSEFGK